MPSEFGRQLLSSQSRRANDDEFQLHQGQPFTDASTGTFAEGHEQCVLVTILFLRFQPSQGVEDVRVGEGVKVALRSVALC
jgi:hypothetical protein